MKGLDNYTLSPDALLLSTNTRKDFQDVFGVVHPGLSIFQVFLDSDLSVILRCELLEDSHVEYMQLESMYELKCTYADLMK